MLRRTRRATPCAIPRVATETRSALRGRGGDAVPNQLSFKLPSASRKKITAAFDGGRLSSDGGVMLLALADPVAIIPFFDRRFQPQLDQSQHVPIHNPTRDRLDEIGVWNWNRSTNSPF